MTEPFIEQELTEEAKLEQKREAIRRIAEKLGPEALRDFEVKFGAKRE